MNSSGPLRPKAADAAVAESTKLRREMLCMLALPLDKRPKGPTGKHRRANGTPAMREIYRRRPAPLFRGNRRRSLFDFLKLRLEPALDQPVEPVEIEVDDRGNVERQELRKHQAADHRNAERLAQFGTGAGAERDRQGAEDRGEGRHHDRTEAQHRRFADRGFGRKADAAALKGKV